MADNPNSARAERAQELREQEKALGLEAAFDESAAMIEIQRADPIITDEEDVRSPMVCRRGACDLGPVSNRPPSTISVRPSPATM